MKNSKKIAKTSKSKIKKQDNRQEDTTVIELVNTFSSATGIELVVEGAKWISIGAFMGMSDAVPGYSGGTTLAVLGVFKKLVLIAKSVFFPEPGITRFKALMFMIPFGLGWIGGIYGFAKLTEAMVENHMGLELIMFFSAFILFAIPVFLMAEPPKLWSFKRKFKMKKTRRWFYFIAGVAIVVTATVFAYLDGGVSFGGDDGSAITDKHYYLGGTGWIKLAGFSFIAGMVTIIPGGSGAIIQLLSNMYENVHWRIMAHPVDNIFGLIIFGAATFAGMLTTTLVMAWGLKKHGRKLAALSFGMLLTSVVAIYFIPDQAYWKELNHWEHIVGAVVSVFAGSSIALYIGYRVRKKRIVIQESM